MLKKNTGRRNALKEEKKKKSPESAMMRPINRGNTKSRRKHATSGDQKDRKKRWPFWNLQDHPIRGQTAKKNGRNKRESSQEQPKRRFVKSTP